MEESDVRAGGRTGGAGVEAGIFAADTLESACQSRPASRDGERLDLYLDSVAGLARDLGADLAALSGRLDDGERRASRAALTSAALRAADLATLAACAVPELPPGSPARLRAAAATHLAAAAARSLALERRALAGPEGPGGYETLDLRGAEWRAGLAARQVEEPRQEDA